MPLSHKIQDIMSKNLLSIQFLRFVAAAMVVLYHATVALNKYFPRGLPKDVIEGAVFGAAGVHVFFVISGFIMVYASFKSGDDFFSTKTFALRRIIRIYPIYIVYSLIYLAFYEFISRPIQLGTADLLKAFLLLPGHSASIIGPGWTLSFEIYFYLCFGFAMILGLRRGLWTLTILFLVSIVAGRFLDVNNALFHVVTSSLLCEFILGAWLGYALVCNRVAKPSYGGTILTLSMIWFCAGAYVGFSALPSVIMWGIPSALLVTGLVFCEREGRLFGVIRRYAFLGDGSYSTYLLHVMLIDAVILTIEPYTKVWQDSPTAQIIYLSAVVALTIISVAVGYSAYSFLEKRMLKRLHVTCGNWLLSKRTPHVPI